MWEALLSWSLPLVVGINALFTYIVLPGWTSPSCARLLPKLNTATSTGLWSLIVALAVAGTVLVPMRIQHWADLKASVNKGQFSFMLRVLNTASEAGYGGAVARLAGLPSPKRQCSTSRPTAR